MDPAVNSPRDAAERETNRMASPQVGFFFNFYSWDFLALQEQVGSFYDYGSLLNVTELVHVSRTARCLPT